MTTSVASLARSNSRTFSPNEETHPHNFVQASRCVIYVVDVCVGRWCHHLLPCSHSLPFPWDESSVFRDTCIPGHQRWTYIILEQFNKHSLSRLLPPFLWCTHVLTISSVCASCGLPACCRELNIRDAPLVSDGGVFTTASSRPSAAFHP